MYTEYKIINEFHEQNFVQFLNKCSYVVNCIYKMCHWKIITSNWQVYTHETATPADFSLIWANTIGF